MVQKRKIIFAGLDRGGKTSIILSLKKQFSFINSGATLGIERSSITQTKCLGFELTAWDLGGQLKFREDYLRNRNRICR